MSLGILGQSASASLRPSGQHQRATDLSFSSGSVPNRLRTFDKSFNLLEPQASSSVKLRIELPTKPQRSLTYQPDSGSGSNSQHSQIHVRQDKMSLLGQPHFIFQNTHKRTLQMPLVLLLSPRPNSITWMFSIWFSCYLLGERLTALRCLPPA